MHAAPAARRTAFAAPSAGPASSADCVALIGQYSPGFSKQYKVTTLSKVVKQGKRQLSAHAGLWLSCLCALLMQGSPSAMRTAIQTYAAGVWILGTQPTPGAHPCCPPLLVKSSQVCSRSRLMNIGHTESPHQGSCNHSIVHTIKTAVTVLSAGLFSLVKPDLFA